MVYSVEECVFIVKTFYKTSFVTVQRQFQRKFNRQQAPVRSAISCLVQKFELTGSVCNNEKGAVGRHRSSHTQDSVAYVHKHCFGVRETLWHVSSHSASKEHKHKPSCNSIWCCILSKSEWCRCSLHPTSSRDLCSVRTSYSLWSSKPLP